MLAQKADGWSLQEIADYWGIQQNRVSLVLSGEYRYNSKLCVYEKVQEVEG